MTTIGRADDRLDATSGVPRYRQLADRLRSQILDGTLPPGGRLPAERDLQARYAVKRETVRQALGLLRVEGWIATAHGSGSTVVDRPPPTALPMHLELRQRLGGVPLMFDHGWTGLAPTVIRREPAPAEIARRLELKPGGRVLVRDRLTGPEGGPVTQLATTYLPASVARLVPAVARRDPGPGGYVPALEGHYGRLRWTVTVGARSPLPEEQAALQLGPGRPLLVLWRLAYAATDRPLALDVYRLAGDGFEVLLPLRDRRPRPAPGPRPEPAGVNALGVPEPAHEADLSDDG